MAFIDENHAVRHRAPLLDARASPLPLPAALPGPVPAAPPPRPWPAVVPRGSPEAPRPEAPARDAAERTDLTVEGGAVWVPYVPMDLRREGSVRRPDVRGPREDADATYKTVDSGSIVLLLALAPRLCRARALAAVPAHTYQPHLLITFPPNRTYAPHPYPPRGTAPSSPRPAHSQSPRRTHSRSCRRERPRSPRRSARAPRA